MVTRYHIQCPTDATYYYFCIKGVPQFGATKSKSYSTADRSEAAQMLKHLQMLVSYKELSIIIANEKVQP